MASQAGEIIHDDSHALMWRIFRSHNPDKPITEFHGWLSHLGQLQKSISRCPFCKREPALRVGSTKEGIRYSVECEAVECPVNPALNEVFDNPEEAVAEWSV